MTVDPLVTPDESPRSQCVIYDPLGDPNTQELISLDDAVVLDRPKIDLVHGPTEGAIRGPCRDPHHISSTRPTPDVGYTEDLSQRTGS